GGAARIRSCSATDDACRAMNEHRPMNRLRLPSVDQVLRSAVGVAASARFGHDATVGAIRRTLATLRESAHGEGSPIPEAAAIAAEATQLHTNLGRAVLPESAIAAAVVAMRSAVALEFDVGEGERGERDDHVRGLIRELTGAEDAAVVNNNAGAVLLVLNTFGAGKDAIVSRGELIEIGGSFRLPDIMARAGARLVEVGTTNRTHLKDYEQ